MRVPVGARMWILIAAESTERKEILAKKRRKAERQQRDAEEPDGEREAVRAAPVAAGRDSPAATVRNEASNPCWKRPKMPPGGGSADSPRAA